MILQYFIILLKATAYAFEGNLFTMKKLEVGTVEEDKGKIIVPKFDVIPETKKKAYSKSYRSEPDYVQQQKENKKTGEDGEQKALKKEKEYLKENGRSDLANKVEHTAKKNPNAGYDIKSFYINGKTKYIEVKSTQSSCSGSNSFYLSAKELEVAKEKNVDYFLYMVFNARDNNYEIVPVDNFIEKISKSIDIKPSTYQCRLYLKD